MGTEQDVARPAARRAGPGMAAAAASALRTLRTAFAASDPGSARLRSTLTTLTTLVVALAVLYGVVTSVWGQPITVSMPGVVVAMIACLAVRDNDPRAHALSVVLLVPPAVVALSLSALLSGSLVAAQAVFVAVAVGSVFLRLLGPRGTAMGMVAFICYFLALFVGTTTSQLPAAAVSVAVGAAATVVVRALLRPRHPDRELRRMLAALGARAGAVLGVLAVAVRDGQLDRRAARRLRDRLAASGETAVSVEEQLDTADVVLPGRIANQELAVRVFDFQLAVEQLTATVSQLLSSGWPSSERREVTASLEFVQMLLEAPADGDRGGSSWDGATHLWSTDPDAQLNHLRRQLGWAALAWRRVVAPSAADPNAGPEPDVAQAGTEGGDDGSGGDQDGNGGLRDRLNSTLRQAVQVAVASGLAIIVGSQLSPTRWFWAVTTAFVVYTGASTRGEILSKGWQRVLGTLAGVVAGVLVATLVGGNTAVAVTLIGVCLFFGFYLMALSPAVMMFFITIMLALLYGLLGQFSVGLLLLRLEETAAGAAIGILVSYLVFPASTRDAARHGVADFLADLSALLGQATDQLGGEAVGRGHTTGPARDLRDQLTTLKTTLKPLTEGLAGLIGRPESRRTIQLLSVCEHHARALSRTADHATGAIPSLPERLALTRAGQAVQANVDTLANAFRTGTPPMTVQSAEAPLDAVEQHVGATPQPEKERLLAAARHLHSIDQAICARATELGATAHPHDAT